MTNTGGERQDIIGFEVPVVQTPPNILTGMSAEFLSVVFPLIYLEPEYREYQGTAFCLGAIASGQIIFATAKHVLEPAQEPLSKQPYVLIPHLTQNVPGRFLAMALPVDAASVATTHNDTALIRCDRRTSGAIELIELRSMRLKFVPAVEGTPTLAIGYARHRITDDLDFTRDFRASHGIVEAIFNESSDFFFGNFPSFQTNSIYDPGMSGGPVFDRDGGCIGIVSRGSNTLEGVEPWAYAAPVACLGELGMDLESDEGSTRTWTFQEMISGGMVNLEGEGGVTLTHDPDGLHLQFLSTDLIDGAPETDDS
jgi:hypothetical protein